MKKSILVLAFALGLTGAVAQGGYDEYITKDLVTFTTKWGKAKDENGEKKPALMIGVKNDNNHPVIISFEMLFYFEEILRERGGIEGRCIPANKTIYGKFNGIYFIPQEFTPEQLERSDFRFEIDEISVKESFDCDVEEEQR